MFQFPGESEMLVTSAAVAEVNDTAELVITNELTYCPIFPAFAESFVAVPGICPVGAWPTALGTTGPIFIASWPLAALSPSINISARIQRLLFLFIMIVAQSDCAGRARGLDEFDRKRINPIGHALPCGEGLPRGRRRRRAVILPEETLI